QTAMPAMPLQARRLFQEGFPLDEVAARLQRTVSTVVEYLIGWILTDDVSAWRFYVLQILPNHSYEDIRHCFLQKGIDRLKPVYESCRPSYSYAQLRVGRAIFRRWPQMSTLQPYLAASKKGN
ncbi:MAG: helix-turn-helix domain-containing protein, partial [Firmicutes bacterium]|nr:helix-turn-helix domain-containing protein [Bacillota bacterium]